MKFYFWVTIFCCIEHSLQKDIDAFKCIPLIYALVFVTPLKYQYCNLNSLDITIDKYTSYR